MVGDAEFIVGLRTDVKKGRFLSSISPDIARQVDWLNAYGSDTDQAYFVIETREGTSVGTIRLYAAQGASYRCGSWLLLEDSPFNFCIESLLILYQYGRALGFSGTHFDVRKGNTSVWRFHERFGAERVGEDADNFFYSLGDEAIARSLNRYARFLPCPISIIP